MPLGYDVAREAPAPVVVVALAAREVQLALAPRERGAAGLEERPRALVDRDIDRHAARLARDVRGQRQELTTLVRERRRLLALDPARVDPLLEGHRPCARGVERRMARGDALHAGPGVPVTLGARARGVAGLAIPQGFALEHPEH